jgi:hypothetical protein
MDQTIQHPPIQTKKASKGKISKNWRNDAEILTRLAAVAEMMLRGAKSHQIAVALNESLTTAKRDIGCVRALWSEESRGEIEAVKDQSLEQYNLVITKAWAEFEKNKSARFLSVVLDAQGKIDDIVGTRAPTLLGVGNAKTIDEVRKKRWNQVAPALGTILSEDQDDANPTR